MAPHMVAATELRPLRRLSSESSREEVQPAISRRPASRGRDQPSILVVHYDPWVRALVGQSLWTLVTRSSKRQTAPAACARLRGRARARA